MSYLLVGDPHGTPDAIDDCRALGRLIIKTARENRPCTVVLLGDQYHTHNILRLEVLAFWRDFFQQLKEADIDCISMVGNHDMPGDGSRRIYSMMAHEDQCKVINEPEAIGLVAFFPYMHDTEELVQVANSDLFRSCHTIICHQTFTYPDYETNGMGAKYENGIYAHDGLNPNLLPQKTVISGHIHTPQEFGKVWYVGAPRWRILTDANTERAIWLVDFDMNGMVSRKAIDTGTVCRQIKYLVDSPDKPITLPLDPRHDWRIDIKGPAPWVKQREKLVAGPGVRVRPFPEQEQFAMVRESEGITVAFTKYIDQYKPKHGTPHAVLRKMVQERLHV